MIYCQNLSIEHEMKHILSYFHVGKNIEKFLKLKNICVEMFIETYL